MPADHDDVCPSAATFQVSRHSDFRKPPLALGANMLATDKVFSPANPWAHVGDEPYEWIRPIA